MAGSSASAASHTKSTVIVLDSSDEEECTAESGNRKAGLKLPSVSLTQIEVRKRSLPSSVPKRIKPTLLSSTVSVKRAKLHDERYVDDPFSDEQPHLDADTSDSINGRTNDNPSSPAAHSSPSTSTSTTCAQHPPTPINEAFATLIEACRAADNTTDMELLISKKLTRYYQTVHPDFVNSKSFIKTVLGVAADIHAQPALVYLKVSSILDELSIRRKSGQSAAANHEEESASSTGDAKKDFQIKRLNQALYVLNKKIAKLDAADVDLDDDDNSTYLLVERYKKRACEIYEKICDITGESKTAYRQVRKPIVFQGTNYPLFNKTITSFVNRTHVFPDLFDVLRCLEHCNSQYEFKLNKDEVKRIAQDAFIKIGKSLQKRRKTDLYETVSYFTSNEADPAIDDAQLQRKLADNEKYHSRINELIDRYAAEQYNPSEATKTSAEPEAIAAESTSHHNNNTINQNHTSAATSTASSEPAGMSLASCTTTTTSTTTISTEILNCSTTSSTSTVLFEGIDDSSFETPQYSPTQQNRTSPSPSLSTTPAADVFPIAISSPLLANRNGFDGDHIELSDDDDAVIL